MGLIRKLLIRTGGIAGFLATSDADLVSANATTDNDFTEGMGRKADTAVHVIGTTASAMAYLKGLMTAGGYVAGTTDTSPLASMDLWSLSGPVIITDIVGIVTTTAIQAQATNTKISFDPDDGGSDVDLCANLDATGDVTGTIYRITGDFSDALVSGLDALESSGHDVKKGIPLSQAGDIKVTYGATSTGQINWFIKYESLGGVITAG